MATEKALAGRSRPMMVTDLEVSPQRQRCAGLIAAASRTDARAHDVSPPTRPAYADALARLRASECVSWLSVSAAYQPYTGGTWYGDVAEPYGEMPMDQLYPCP